MTKSKIKLIIVSFIVLLIIIGIICFFTFKSKEIITYTVTFDSDGGTLVEEQIVEEGSTAFKPDDPEKEGYSFVEWLLNGNTFDFNSIIDNDIILYASWEEESPDKEMVTVQYDTDGGSTIPNSIIEKGGKLTNPVVPEKEGYSFVGWQLDGQNFDFDTEINSDIELVAKWEKNKLTNNNTTSNSSKNTNTNTNSGKSTITNNNNGNSSSQTNPQTPTVNKYTVTFNSNGGSTVLAQTIVEGNKVTKPGNPTKNGYTFMGWQLDGKSFDFNTSITKDITLTASWRELATYTVTFNENGGSSVSSQNVVEGNKVTKPGNPTKEGYNFNSWQLNSQNFDFNTAVSSNITLNATWSQKNYVVKVTSIDQYSPDRLLSVYEDGNKINVLSIKYNGTTLCSGSNLVVNMYEIVGISSVVVVLTGGTSVTASVN